MGVSVATGVIVAVGTVPMLVAVAVAVAIDPTLMVTESYPCEVETGGSLTHGATIIDRRVRPGSLPNADVVVEIDVDRTVECILDTLTS